MPITRPPDVVGPYGKAWHLALEVPGKTPDQAACLYGALIHAPKAHPLWTYWLISAQHLRDVPGQARPAVKRFPGAEHEILIMSLNPEHGDPDVDRYEREGQSFHFLTPPDFAEQFVGSTDAQIVQMCKWAVRLIVEGQMSPDADFRGAWEIVFHNTAQHMRTGRHPPGD